MHAEWQEYFFVITARYSCNVVSKWAVVSHPVPTEYCLAQNEHIWGLLMHSLLEILQNDQPAYI